MISQLLRKVMTFLVVCIMAIPSANASEPKVMSPVDMVEISRLSDPDLSPDGRYLIYSRSQTDWAENVTFDRYVLLDLKSGNEVPTFPAAKSDEDFGSVSWAPDSRGFITLLRRKPEAAKKTDDKPKRQAYFFEINTRSLSQLTWHKTNVGNIQWASDGTGFYFTAKKPHEDAHEKALKDKFVITAYESDQPEEIWFFNIVTRQSQNILSGDFYVRGYKLSRDGKRILYMRANGPNGDDRHAGDLWDFDIASKTSNQLTKNGYAESDYTFSPDNSSIAYIATVNAEGEGYYEDNLFIENVGENKPHLVLPKMPMEILDFNWSASGDAIYILGNTGLRNQIYKYKTETNALNQLTTGDHSIFDWSYDATSKTQTYLAASALDPGEVFMLKTAEVPTQISQEYADWPTKYKLPKQEAFQWKGRRGADLEGLLVYPVDYRKGDQFPLVTITHGGPRSSSQFGSWNMSRSVPVLAGQGYGVFLPNHRGGAGYGDKFMRDMVGGYFNNAHLDVMSGIDALIKTGLADPGQLIKQGWSAGGHMTNKLITFTDRFKAASSGAGASDWISMYGESDVRYRRTPWFGGAPWQKNAPLEVYQKNSPLKDTWKVTTPTLFWNGGSDVRVPPTQGIMMYRGVKSAGADTKLYLAPDQPHGFRLPSYKLFKINTELAWYAKHLNKDVPPAIMPDIPEGKAETGETD